ncbi:MAG TPA: hypothetical protein VHH73_10740, partial [Verrucomicrobiae bacterium]|nr:hypothetical protein [Verrucomicrobiae bacterium]
MILLESLPNLEPAWAARMPLVTRTGMSPANLSGRRFLAGSPIEFPPRTRQTARMNLEAIQAALRAAELAGWLFFDHH